MNYYIEMIKDFVLSEMKKTDGSIMDDGEYVFACGLAFQKLTKRDRKNVVDRKRQVLSEAQTLDLLTIEMNHMIKEYQKKWNFDTKEEMQLIGMIQQYHPKGENVDQILLEVMQEAFHMPMQNNRYERQTRYQNKVGLVSKTYKLNGHVVEEFANACKRQGVPLGPTLTELMLQYIENSKSDRTI